MRLPKTTRRSLGAILISLLSVWSLTSIPATFAWSQPSNVTLSGLGCSGSNCNVYDPDIAVESNHVHMIFIQDSTNYLYYSRGTTSDNGSVAWEAPRRLSTNVDRGAEGAAITADNTGTVHVSYSISKQIYYIQNPRQGAFGNWSEPVQIGSSSERINNLAMALDADRTPYVSWAQGAGESQLSLAYRKADGNWTSRDLGSKRSLYRNPRMVVTGSGDAAIVHIMSESKRRDTDNFFSVVYSRGPRVGPTGASEWSRSFNDSGSDEASYITIDPVTNILYAGYVDSVGGGYRWSFSSSSDLGLSWTSLVRAGFGGSSFWGRYTPMTAFNNTLYMALGVQEGAAGKVGIYDVRYNQTTNEFTAPQTILNYADSNYKVAREIGYGITTNAKVAVWVRDFIEGLSYNSDAGGIVPVITPQATVTVTKSDANQTSATLNIALTNVVGEPNKMRVSVDNVLTPNVAVEDFKANFTRTVSTGDVCAHTVYVQLINETRGLASDALTGSITVDTKVQADVQIGNPYKRSNAVVFSELQQLQPLVNDGDASYTRVANFYVEVNGSGECSQLTNVRVGRSAGQFPLDYAAKSNYFANILPIPGQVTIGSNTVVLQVADSASNTQIYTREIIYDPIAPTLVTSGTLTVGVPTTGPNILTSLSLRGNQVQDNLYPGRGYWGVLVANSRTATNPLTDTTLVWQPIQVPGTETDATLTNWSLLSGLATAQQTAGDYYVYVRFIDGAGNATEGYLTSKVTLSQIIKPTTSLPIVVKQ